MDTGQKLREGVAEEVRALIGRRRTTGAKLAEAIGRSEMYVSRRLRGETAFDLDDLERIAAILNVEVSDLLPRRNEGRTVVIAGEPRMQTTVPKLHLTDQPHPIGSPNRTAPASGTRRPARLFPAHA